MLTKDDTLPLHQILVPRDTSGVRALVEARLGVETWVEPFATQNWGGWAIRFYAPDEVDLDFLRPDVLPPKEIQEDQ